ncbi:MAG: hypothetical protein JO090_12135, partial [Rhizobacter sp.]|nr:hypothetical protein [Rhizobacter sp.]
IVVLALTAGATVASAQTSSPTRAEMHADVLQARARHELVPAGEAVQPFAPVAATSARSRADVRDEVLQARARGELVPAGEATVAQTTWVPSMLARAEVKESVLAARRRGELVPAGEGVNPVERQAATASARSAGFAANRHR